MAPRDTPKAAPKIQRALVKTTKPKPSPVAAVKKTISKSNTDKTIKVNNTAIALRPRTSTVPKMSTPKPKEKSVPLPGSVTKSAKKAHWKRRPKPAHSGVPVPEKMKKLLEKHFQDPDCSL